MIRKTSRASSACGSRNPPTSTPKSSEPKPFFVEPALKVFAFRTAAKYKAGPVWLNNCMRHTQDILDALLRLTATKEKRRVVFRELHESMRSTSFEFDLSDPTDKAAAFAAAKFDARISKYKPIYVPKYVSENDFFRNYFSFVAHIRNEYDKPTRKAVLVGSTNPVKLNATKQAFAQCFPGTNFEFFTCKVDSGVSDQPMSDKETRQGAANRARNAYSKRKEVLSDELDVAVTFCAGLEGGCALTEVAGVYECYAWIAIYEVDSDKVSLSRTASFQLPDSLNELLKQGFELGKADEMVYQVENSKQKGGTVGMLTKGIIDRTEYYRHAAVLAIAPFAFKDIYNKKAPP